MSPANTEVLKEPRGFIKFLEIVIAICAFATTTSHHSYSQFRADCELGEKKFIDLPFGYAYRLQETTFPTPICDSTKKHTNDTGVVSLYGDYSSAAQFFVFVGVMAFLYALAATVVYVIWDENYQQNDKLPIVDFIVTIVFAGLWLIASSAWADALTKVKHYTDPSDYFNDKDITALKECSGSYNVTCHVTQLGNFASLNVSIIFGFLNLIIWSGNLWFLYKETKWFKPTTLPSPDTPQNN